MSTYVGNYEYIVDGRTSVSSTAVNAVFLDVHFMLLFVPSKAINSEEIEFSRIQLLSSHIGAFG